MMAFIEVREPHTDKLLFRFDPLRDLIEIQRRGMSLIVDLHEYRLLPVFDDDDVIELDVHAERLDKSEHIS